MTKDVVRLLGHPLHASMVHLPLGLLLTVPLWDGLALAGVSGPWWPIGFWVTCAGIAFALAAALIGLTDLVRSLEGRVRDVGVWHMLASVTAVAAFGVALLLRGGPAGPASGAMAVLGLDIAGFALLGVAGWLGGELVFGHGVGRRIGPEGPP